MSDVIGNLYFLQVDDAGPVKIGWTRGNVHDRMRQIQRASPYILHWIGACPAPFSAEDAAHQELKAHRLRGEWFHPTDEVMNFVAKKSEGFCPQSYGNEVHRFDLRDRLMALACNTSGKKKVWNRALVEEITAPVPVDLWHWAKWLEVDMPLTDEQFAALEASLDEHERRASA